MNELRLTGLLKDRYKTHLGGLHQKLNKPGLCKPCSYSNNLAAHPSSEKMTRPLRLKIHDALHSSVLMDAEGMGIFIGGRRRNRKKKNKKNGQNKKKCKKNDKNKNMYNESSGSSTDSGSSGRSSPKSEEKVPLLSYCLDENENFDPSDPYCYFCDDEETDSNEMSFLFKKKAKEVKTEKAVVNEMQTRVEEPKQQVPQPESPPPAQAVEKLEKPALEESSEKAVDGGAVTESKPADGTEAAAPVVDGETKPSEKEEKSEKSPLVNSKDMGPGGCLCCTIL